MKDEIEVVDYIKINNDMIDLGEIFVFFSVKGY